MKSKVINAALTVAIAIAFVLAAFLPFVNLSSQNDAYASGAADWVPTYNGNYYDNIDDTKSGKALRDDLANLITTTHKHQTSYSDLKSLYATTDKNPNGSGILLFYTGTPASSYSAAGANREHVWAKKGGDAFSPPESECGSDAHHIRPTDMSLNSSRGNLPFDEVPQTSNNRVDEKQGGTYSGSDPDRYCYRVTNGWFYPAKGYRGATARILFYVQTRWGNKNSLFFADGSFGNKGIGKLSTLMKWHLEEPPTDAEILRNNAVYNVQGNRNPFIDHPEYATKIFSHTDGLKSIDGTALGNSVTNVIAKYGDYNGSSVDVEQINFNTNNYSMIVGETLNLANEITVTPAEASKAVTLNSSNTNVAKIENGSVVACGAGTAVITATSVKDGTKTATTLVTVKSLSAISVTGNCKKVYNVGETFDPSGLTVTASYSDGSSAVIENSRCQWLDGSKNTTSLAAETTTVLCKYGGKEFVIEGIIVKYMQSISVSGTPVKTVYEVGDRFEYTGLTVTAHFSDGSEETIPSSSCQWLDGSTGQQTFSKGTTSVTCKYGNLSATVNGIVIREIVRISVTGIPVYTVYGENQEFNPSGLTVTAYFNEGAPQVLDNRACVWIDNNGSRTLTKDSIYVTCKYGTVFADESERITITMKLLKELKIEKTPDKTEYIVGSKFNPEGLIVKQVFTEGSETTVDVKLCVWTDQNGSVTLSENSTEIICKFGGKECKVPFDLIVKNVTGIYVTGTPVKSEYSLGQTFDSLGLVVKLKFDKGSDEVIGNALCSWVDNNGKEELSYYSTSVTARYVYGGKTLVSNAVTVTVRVSQAVSRFEIKVKRVCETTVHKEKFEEIKGALAAYAELTADEKAGVAESYRQLNEQIKEYNEYSDTLNTQLTDAVYTAAVAAAQSMAAILAALYIIGKKSK